MLVGGGRDSRLVFLQVSKPFAGCVQVLFGWWGGCDKTVIHIVSVPKTLVLTVFSSVCTTHCGKDVEQGTLSQASMPLATMTMRKTTAFTA